MKHPTSPTADQLTTLHFAQHHEHHFGILASNQCRRDGVTAACSYAFVARSYAITCARVSVARSDDVLDVLDTFHPAFGAFFDTFDAFNAFASAFDAVFYTPAVRQSPQAPRVCPKQVRLGSAASVAVPPSLHFVSAVAFATGDPVGSATPGSLVVQLLLSSSQLSADV